MLIDQTERSDEMVTERQQDILNLIIDIFTKTHEPVGSKALQESINSSSATIRNDMAELEKQGLLEKAHTSSGRMPSVAGFQYYVKHSLDFDRLAENEVKMRYMRLSKPLIRNSSNWRIFCKRLLTC